VLELTGDVATDIAGKEEDIIVNATINGESVSSQSGATVAFQEKLGEANAPTRSGAGFNKIRSVSGGRKAQRRRVY
jgi:hypothetical protein